MSLDIYLRQGGYVIMFSSALVSLFVSCITQKLLNQFLQNSVEKSKVAHRPRKKSLDFDGDPRRSTLEIGFL